MTAIPTTVAPPVQDERRSDGILPSRVDSIQWLRGIAALLVVTVHAGMIGFSRAGDNNGAHAPVLFNLMQFGNSGVDLFFVISGFVMTHSLDRTPGVRSFIIARWRRIWPLFVLASLVFVLLFGSGDAMTLPRLLPSFAILPLSDTTGYHQPALPVGWTLGFEVMFYLLVAFTIARRGGAVMLMSLTISAGIIGLAVVVPWAPARMLFNPIIIEFAFGIIVWLIWSRHWGVRARPALVAIGILLLAGGIASPSPLFIPANPVLVVDDVHVTTRTLCWGVPWALITLGLLGETGVDGAAARMLGALGNASYSIYLFHFIILEVMWHFVPLPAAVLPFAAIGILASAAGGLLLYHLVERPLLRLLRSPPHRRPGTLELAAT